MSRALGLIGALFGALSLATCQLVIGAPRPPCELCGGLCIDLLVSSAHCGVCDRDCLGSACDAGICEPVLLATMGERIACSGVAGDDLVFITTTGEPALWRMPKTGGTPERLTTDVTSNGCYKDIRKRGDDILLVEQNRARWLRPDPQNGALIWPLDTLPAPNTYRRGLLLGTDAVILFTQQDIRAMLGDGGAKRTLEAGTTGAIAFGATLSPDEGTLYYAHRVDGSANGTDEILAMPLGFLTLPPRSLGPTTEGAVRSMVVADGVLYFATADRVEKIALDGGAPETILADRGAVFDTVRVRDGYLYVASARDFASRSGAVYRVRLSDGERINIFDRLYVTNVEVDDRWAYAFTRDESSGEVLRVAR
jgi:hypothetical protein